MNCENSIFEKLIQCIRFEISSTRMMDKETLQSILLSQNSELRALLAKALAFEDDAIFAHGILCQLSEDNDVIVRAEAIDSLSMFPEKQSFSILCSALSDSSEIVRFYAAIGVGIVGNCISRKTASEQLLDALPNEKSSFSLVGIYEGLYILDHHDSLENLFHLFQDEDYHVKCAVVHSLDELLEEKNYDLICNFIKSIDCNELPFAVVDALKQLRYSIFELKCN